MAGAGVARKINHPLPPPDPGGESLPCVIMHGQAYPSISGGSKLLGGENQMGRSQVLAVAILGALGRVRESREVRLRHPLIAKPRGRSRHLLSTSYCLPPTAYCLLPTGFCLLSVLPHLTPSATWRNLGDLGAYRFRREPLRLGGMSGVHTTRDRRGTMTTANTQYAYAA